MQIGQYKQQGDVLVKRIAALPAGAVKLDAPKLVLQQSETTGHHHHFRPDAKVEIYTVPAPAATGLTTITPNENKYILVYEDTELYHGRGFDAEPAKSGTGDHNALMVPAGVYEIDIVREYDYDYHETRRVVD